MPVRVQVILADDEKELFRRQAEKEGISLSAWLRRAGIRQAAAEGPRRISTVEGLKTFFQERDALEQGREPDWEDHLAVIRRSRQPGADA